MGVVAIQDKDDIIRNKVTPREIDNIQNIVRVKLIFNEFIAYTQQGRFILMQDHITVVNINNNCSIIDFSHSSVINENFLQVEISLSSNF